MIKKDYIQPTMKVERVDIMSPMLTISVKTEGLGDDGLGFDDQGGNQGEAWTKGNNGSDTWDFEW